MKCLHGLRFLSIVWIMLGNSYMMEGSLPITNMNTYREKVSIHHNNVTKLLLDEMVSTGQ